MSEITSRYKKKAVLLTILSWILCFGTAVVFLTIAINKYTGNETQAIIELSGRFGAKAQGVLDRAKTIIMTSLISMIPMIILSVIVKDKIRPLVWMLNIILSNILLGSVAMYIVFSVWFIDEYILRLMAKSALAKYVINKEIDKRE